MCPWWVSSDLTVKVRTNFFTFKQDSVRQNWYGDMRRELYFDEYYICDKDRSDWFNAKYEAEKGTLVSISKKNFQSR